MTPDTIFDYCRFSFLFLSLIFQHIVHNYLVYSLISSEYTFFNYIIQILSVFYISLCFLRKGYVDYNSKEFLRLDYKPTTRYCQTCKGYKPLRTHHCRKCDRCIKKMDHHCMWLSVCVNYENHGDFIRFLLFSVVSMASSLVGFCIYIYNNICSTPMKFLLAYLFLYSISLLILAGVMLKLQIDSIYTNRTFLEDLYFHKFDDYSPYDKGLWENWTEVMGSVFLLWMCKPFGNGVDFVRSDGFDDEDIAFV